MEVVSARVEQRVSESASEIERRGDLHDLNDKLLAEEKNENEEDTEETLCDETKCVARLVGGSVAIDERKERDPIRCEE